MLSLKSVLASFVLAVLLIGGAPAAAVAAPASIDQFERFFTYSSAPNEILGKTTSGIRKLTAAEKALVPKDQITVWGSQFVQDPDGLYYKVVWESVTPISEQMWKHEGSPTPVQVIRAPKMEYYTYASAPSEVIVRTPLGVRRHAKTGEAIPQERVVHWGGTIFYKNAGETQIRKKSGSNEMLLTDAQWRGEGSPTLQIIGTYTPPAAPTITVGLASSTLAAPAELAATVTMTGLVTSCDVTARNTANGGDIFTETIKPSTTTWSYKRSTEKIGSGAYDLRVACDDSTVATADFTVTGTLEQQMTAALTPASVPAGGLNEFAPGEASTNPAVHTTGCHAPPNRITPILPCHTGAKESGFVVWLVGDSHAAAWFPAIDRIAAENNVRLITATKSACSPTTSPLKHPITMAATYPECTTFQGNVLKGMETYKPDLIITSGDTGIMSSRLGGFGAAITEYVNRAPRVVVLGDFPNMRGNPGDCLATNAADYTACHAPRASAQSHSVIRQMKEITEAAGAVFVPTFDMLCVDELCPAVAGATRMYKDASHISPAAAVLAQADLHAALAPYLTETPRNLKATTFKASGDRTGTRIDWDLPGNTTASKIYRYEIRWGWETTPGEIGWMAWQPVSARNYSLVGLELGAVRHIEVRALHSGGFTAPAKLRITQR